MTVIGVVAANCAMFFGVAILALLIAAVANTVPFFKVTSATETDYYSLTSYQVCTASTGTCTPWTTYNWVTDLNSSLRPSFRASQGFVVISIIFDVLAVVGVLMALRYNNAPTPQVAVLAKKLAVAFYTMVFLCTIVAWACIVGVVGQKLQPTVNTMAPLGVSLSYVAGLGLTVTCTFLSLASLAALLWQNWEDFRESRARAAEAKRALERANRPPSIRLSNRNLPVTGVVVQA